MAQPNVKRPDKLTDMLTYKNPDVYYGPLMKILENDYEQYKAEPTFAFKEYRQLAPDIAETMKVIGGICCHLQYTGSVEKAVAAAPAFHTAAYAPTREAVVFCQKAIADIQRAVTDVSASVQLIEGVIQEVDLRIKNLLSSKSAITSFFTLGTTWTQEELLEAHDLGLIVTVVTYYLFLFFKTVILPFRLWAVYEYVRQDMLCHNFLKDRTPEIIAKAMIDSQQCTVEKGKRLFVKNDLFRVKDRQALYKRVGPAIRAAGELFYRGIFRLMNRFNKFTRTGDSLVMDGWNPDMSFGEGIIKRQIFKDESLGKFAQVMNPFGKEYIKGWAGRFTGAIGGKGFFDTVSSIEGVIVSFMNYRAAVQGSIQARTLSIKAEIFAMNKGLIPTIEKILCQSTVPKAMVAPPQAAAPPQTAAAAGGGRRRLNKRHRKTYKKHAAARRSRRAQNL